MSDNDHHHIIIPATRRTTLSAVSSCNTERGCCFCQSSRETRSYSMLITPAPPSLVWSSPSVTVTGCHHDQISALVTVLASESWFTISCPLQPGVQLYTASPHQDTPCLQTSLLGPDTWDFPRLSPSPVVTAAAGSAHSQNCRKQTTLGKLSGRFPLISLVTDHIKTFHWSLGVTSLLLSSNKADVNSYWQMGWKDDFSELWLV